jgi:hypothetical protein
MELRTRKGAVGSAVFTAVLMAQGAVIAPASAETGIAACKGQDGVVSRSVALASNTFKMTHADVLDLGKGVGYHRSNTLEKVTVLTAAAGGSVEVTGGASWKIVKLDSKVTVSLSASGSHTRRESITEDFDVAKAGRNRKILFYQGNQYVSGRWHQLTCSRAPGVGTRYEGPVHSFTPVNRHGAIECNHRLYDVGSVRYQVTRQAGC